ncbi:MAG: ATP synthase F1 subunit epsilon [Deltaproteobacteria bacterium]|nr:ATP synthase F1 subunit epsilon [Deltaproteobacteria bacterium]
MKLDVVTPHGAVVTDLEATDVTLPGFLGEMGILPGHVAMMAGLGVGPMLVQTEKGPQLYAICGGFVEVLEEKVRVLTETCERHDQIDPEKAQAKLAKATERLEPLSPADGETYQVAHDSVKKHENRIKVAEEGKGLV